jgi:hypothetical protein
MAESPTVPFLNARERATLLAVATTALPAGRRFPAADAATVERAEALLSGLGAATRAAYHGLLVTLDAEARALTRHRFSSLPLGRRLELLEGWQRHETTRQVLRALLAPLKIVYFDDERVYEAAQCQFRVEAPRVETARWQSQIIDGHTLEKDEEIDCDAVVVGTGAGGAVVARELAEAGWAVLLLEEGQHFTRRDFNGRPAEMTRRLYRNGGLTVAFGNTVIPIPVGKTVGGTTTINAGTCLRPPESTFAEWEKTFGLTELAPDKLDRFYRRVEGMLRVEPAKPEHFGATGNLIARGCDTLGFSHGPLPRDAPDCDGQGTCCLGCPTDAKRSTNVSYIPAALERSAQLMTRVKVERVLVEHDRAVGVRGSITKPDGQRINVTVRARVVVPAACTRPRCS